MSGRFYEHEAAAEYLGIHPRTLDHRVMRGLIKPMRMFNKDRVYTEESLNELKERMSVMEGQSTMQEIAHRYNINYHRVYRAFRTRRSITPFKTIGKVPVYSEDQVEKVAELEGWKSE